MVILDDWLPVAPLASERLRLEPLRVEHAAEMAGLLDDPQLHTFIGGQSALFKPPCRTRTGSPAPTSHG
jgi:hypothetical protein